MNIAMWLERAGKSHAARPAIAKGTRVVHDFAALAARAARLAGALRNEFGLKSGDRVAIVAKNCTEYVELLFAIWHAGLAAVPANAKLHGAELGYIIEQSGARVCFASGGLDDVIAPHAPKSLERLDSHRRRGLSKRCSAPIRLRWCRAAATIWPGCFIRPAPPASRKARC